MKTNRTRICTRIIALVLCAVMLTLFSLITFAEERATEKQYVKDVKLIYADSKEEAKKSVPEGYVFLDNNLNAGTDEDAKVYFVYSTTTNPDEAVTDIKMMNMKGGFVLSDYEEQMKNVNESVKKLANDVKLAAEVFAENYVKGTYGAKAAYRALSAFTLEKDGTQTLADYIVYGDVEESFYVKLVLNAHQNVLSAVVSALAMAVQGEEGNTWLDRLQNNIEDPLDVEELPNYWDDSVILWKQFYSFYEVYKTIDHSKYDPQPPEKNPDEAPEDADAPIAPPVLDTETQPDIANNGTEALYEIAYRTLDKYKFETGETFTEMFLDPAVFKVNKEQFENFFCMLEVMTPAELAMMSLGGPLNMILSTGMNKASYEDYIKRMDEITGGETACYIWEGVNVELFHSSIGITDEAARKIAQTEFERELNNEGDSLGMAGLKTAGLIAACGAVALGVGLITYYSFGALMLSCFGGSTLGAVTSAISVAGTIFGAVSLALGVAAVVVALVVAIVFFVIWIIEIFKEEHPEYTEIPEFMYDYVEDNSGNNQFILYEGVKFQDGRVADVNVWEGKEWHAMYVSHDKAAGAPIEADVKVTYGDGKIDEGYAGLTSFGYVNAQNLNAFAFEDEVEGIFVTYRQEKLKGDYARRDYLSDVKLFGGEDPAKVALELKNQGYTLHEQNLTPSSDYVTYLGYKTTNSKSRALTDIRIAYAYNAKQYTTGANKASYAASGSTGDGKLTLYATTISLFGTPIRSDFLILNDRNAPAGYEPVNYFSGGPATNLNLKDGKHIDTEKSFYLYFLPSETYTSGKEYLGGVAAVYDEANRAFENGIGSTDRASDVLGYKVLYTTKGENNLEGALIYSVTYNPYRAIYGVTALKASGEMGSAITQTVSYDGVVYTLTRRLMVTNDNTVSYRISSTGSNNTRLYTAGIYDGGKPMLASDLFASGDRTALPEGYVPVSAIFSAEGGAADLAKGFGQKLKALRPGGQPKSVSFEPFYLFVKGKAYKEGNYVTDIFLSSKQDIIGSSEQTIPFDSVSAAYVLNQLAASGAHNAILKNLNLADGNNSTFIGYNKRVKKAGVEPITDIILYYTGETSEVPKSEMVFDRITYKRAGEANIFCEEGEADSVCKRVYLYYTTNPAAGSPIIDIQIDNTAIVNGWETARTQNNKALYDDMDEYSGNMWFLHMKRTAEDPKYISEVVIGVGGSDAEAKAILLAAGCDYMLEKDLNNNVGAHSDYVYLGYKRTSDPNEAIRDLKTTHDDEVDNFVKNGATYYKIDGNLNSYTNIFADDIFLYYTRDAKAGTPITSLGTSGSVANWSHGEGGRYVVKTVLDRNGNSSDLNDGAGGDYIYLLLTRDKQDGNGALASMIGDGSLVVVIAFAVAAAGAIVTVCIVHKKRRAKVKAGALQEDAAAEAVEASDGSASEEASDGNE